MPEWAQVPVAQAGLQDLVGSAHVGRGRLRPTVEAAQTMTAKLPSKTTAVIGAGPYGLSIAAHLRARGVPTQVFGEPLESWQAMPARMNLKSVWSASSLSDPEGAFSLDKFCRATGSSPAEPIPLAFFLKYAEWFHEHSVPEIDRVFVQFLRRQGSAFELTLSDGRAVDASRVVVAVGVRPVAFVPEFARRLPAQPARHSREHIAFSRFLGVPLGV